ncbi:hypothetical protein EJB05_36910, partial [Eragrostis curvula]
MSTILVSPRSPAPVSLSPIPKNVDDVGSAACSCSRIPFAFAQVWLPPPSAPPLAGGERPLSFRGRASSSSVKPAAAVPERSAVRIDSCLYDLVIDFPVCVDGAELPVVGEAGQPEAVHCRDTDGEIPNLHVWFQRPKDIIRKLQSGDLDLGIGNDDLVVVHDALEFGHCRLSLAVPMEGIFKNVNSLEELRNMSEWTAERPLRDKFLKQNDFKHVKLLSADGALESYPPMGMADAIVDLVSSGATLRENNLKEIEGGEVLESQGSEAHPLLVLAAVPPGIKILWNSCEGWKLLPLYRDLVFSFTKMEYNKDEAAKEKEIAEKKFAAGDLQGAKRFALKAQKLFSGLEGVAQMLTTIDIYLASEVNYHGEEDWYAILSVEPTADHKVLKKEYRKLIIQLRPDKNKSLGAQGAFQMVSDAYEVLSDKTKRAVYDLKRNTIRAPRRGHLNQCTIAHLNPHQFPLRIPHKLPPLLPHAVLIHLQSVLLHLGSSAINARRVMSTSGFI